MKSIEEYIEMNARLMAGSKRSSCALAFLLCILAPSSFAAEFYAIVDNFGRKLRSARMDVSVDYAPGPSDVAFDVFSEDGVPMAQFVTRTNANGFASSSSVVNLVDLTVGQPMLVRALTSASATPSAATLYIDSMGAPMTIALWPTHRRDGTALGMGKEFHVALGAFRSASILVANVGGTDQVIDVHVGTRGADGGGIYSNPRLQPMAIWRVNLSPAEARSNLIVTSTGPVVVQFVIDDGRGIQSYQVLPTQ